VTDPVVRWDPAKRSLVDQAGNVVTDAQDAKARRYLAGGHVKRVATESSTAAWGEPSHDIETYELTPIPGCHQLRRVIVTTYRDGAGTVWRVGYVCDCQAYVMKRRACSHILAVHRARNQPPHVAGVQESETTPPVVIEFDAARGRT
jgi:hypothetical protein